MRIQRKIDFRSTDRPGFVLVVVLIILVVLTLAAYRYSDMTSAEYRATDSILKSVEAKAMADSGIHYCAAVLSDPNAFTNVLNSNPYDNSAVFQNATLGVDGSSGRFSIMCVDYTQDPSSGMLPVKYGVIDESSKINLNAMMQLDPTGTILYNMLMLLPNMTADIANSIIDWLDPDDDTRASGAETDYYESLTPPYRAKNAPLDSIEELLLVKGVTPALLFGTDINRNGKLDPEEQNLGDFNVGWAPYLTVYSREQNLSSAGTPRINVNGSSLSTIYTQLKAVIDPNIAAYLMAYRIYGAPAAGTKNNTGSSTQLTTVIDALMNAATPPRAARTIPSLYALIGTSISIPGAAKQPATVYAFSIKDAASATTSLATMLDNVTTSQAQEIPARVNVNTAAPAVLLCLPGLVQSDVDAIVGARPVPGTSDPTDVTYSTTAWLYTQASLTLPKMQALEKYITARAQVYRIQSIGFFEKYGPVVRVEAVVDTNNGSPRIIYYRDLTELGRAIDPRNN